MSESKFDITVVILTFNEERHIERCLCSVMAFAKDIVIVDAFSSDRTVEYARRLGARIFQNPWVNYATQFQWALDHCGIATDWVMRLDADEIVEADLAAAMDVGLGNAKPGISGYYVKRKYKFLGQWIRRGGMYPVYVLRVWKTGSGRIEQRWMDEHIVLHDGQADHLDGNIVDDNLNPVSWWIQKHNGYASREMIDVLNQRYRFLPKDDTLAQQSESSQAQWKRFLKERVYNRLPLFCRPILYFFYRYVVQMGFCDGTLGFGFHLMHALWYRSLVDLKVLEAEGWIKDCATAEERCKVLAEKTGLNLSAMR